MTTSIHEEDPNDLAEQLLSSPAAADSNPGSDYYRQSAKFVLVTLIGAYRKLGRGFDPQQLANVLGDASILEELHTSLVARHQASEEARNLRLFLDSYRSSTNADGPENKPIDMTKMRKTLGSIVARLA